MINEWDEALRFVITSVVIGAVIGGGTNRLAIAMLFRPYRAVRIGPWTLPFTPGLIPKRRHDLAVQLGRTVREYLINGEALSRMAQSKEVQLRVTGWLKARCRRTRLPRLIGQMATVLAKRDEWPHLCIKDFVSTDGAREMKRLAGEWAPEVNQALVRFMNSDRGAQLLQQFYSHWTKTQGWIGRLSGTLLDTDKVVEKTRNYLVHTLASPRGYDAVRTLINDGMDAVLEQRVTDFFTWVEARSEQLSSVGNEVVEKAIERMTPFVMESLADRGEQWLDVLQLDKLVTEQVETFSLKKLEDMIVKVAKKELRMITWIGALIGGVIGLFQGLFVTLFG